MKWTLFFIAGLAIFSSFLMGGLGGQEERPPLLGNPVALVDPETTINPKSTLQFRHLVTPTPTPPRGGGSGPTTPAPTGGSLCQGKKLAVDLLLDMSGSMNFSIAGSSETRFGKLMSAVRSFVQRMQQNSENVIGIQIFSDPDKIFQWNRFNNFCREISGGACVVVPFQKISPSVTTTINNLVAGGSTYMLDGFELARTKITSARSQYPDSQYKWAMIFLTDGVPNDLFPGPGGCDEGPDPQQDPRSISGGLKTTLELHTIGLELDSLRQNTLGSYCRPRGEISSYAKDLLRDVATAPEFFHDSSAGQLQEAFDLIFQDVCR